MAQHPHSPDKGTDQAARYSKYLSQDTIAAISSAVGGAVAMIRISGARAFEIAERVSNKELNSFEPRKLHLAQLSDRLGPIDSSLLVKFISPESFTGEDVVEFQIHGGALTASRLMEGLCSFGARQALPGEFSFRAVRNGKMTLSQAQAVSDLIAATNSSAAELALDKLSGSQNRILSEISHELRQIATLGEVGIDFSDQDIEEVSLPTLKKRVAALEIRLQALASGYARGTRIQEGVSAAFVGLPNAGKSSFFNALLGEDRSIVSDLAGTTRDVVREKLTLRGEKSEVTLRLEDTAGLRAAEHPVEKIGVERSYRAAREADLVIAVFDPTATLADAMKQWIDLNHHCGGNLAQKSIGIITKSDLTSDATLETFETRMRSETQIQIWLRTSATRHLGIHEAAQRIALFCDQWITRVPGEVLLTRLDHLQAVEAALAHLRRATGAVETDLFASDLRQALYAMGPLIGDTLPDDILGKIFSDFCIGK